MILISHRGNVNGKMESWENEPTYIDLAISKGYDVEVDVWYKDNMLWLGHDKPQYGVNITFFNERMDNLWIHCKDLETLEYFLNNTELHYFFHKDDDSTITNGGFVWQHPNNPPIKNSIAVLPEINNWDTTECLGVCSDYIKKYKK